MSYAKIITLIVLSIICIKPCYSKKPVTKTTANAGFAVVELFTSEGCSSCPAAEKALSEIHNAYKQNVYVMEFHVDYWNYLGWEDVYSSKAFTERQQHYARLLQLSSTYTPQAIVNGKNELVGSNKSKLGALIDDNLQKAPVTSLQLSAKASGGNVMVTYNVNNNKGQLLNIALVQKKAESNVKRGENSGRKLEHIHVVRVLKTIDITDKSGSVSMALPAGLSATDCAVIAYAQLKDTWEVSGAAEVDVE
jgi:hypothetical protein